jgi:nucleoside-diphosphate-sugar epimerase
LRLRALVTGATGFIGSHMAEALVGKGWEVVCPVRDVSKLRHLSGIQAHAVPLSGLSSEIGKGPGFDYVIHLAGATRARDYRGYREANVDSTRRLLGLFSEPAANSRLKKFVLVSSQAACGPSPDDGTPVTESDPLCPVSLYGRSKREAEEVALSFSDRVPVTVIRPPTVFGPRDTDVLAVFKCTRYRLAPCLAGPDRMISMIYVEDLVEGILTAAQASKAEGQVYFLANSQPVVWREFVLQVATIAGCRAITLRVPLFVMRLAALAGDLLGKVRETPSLFRSEKLEEMKQIAWVCSPEKAYRELQWRPQTPLPAAIEKTLVWYREHRWI